jgi:hypothetical protein
VLDDPASRQDDEAGLHGDLVDDLDLGAGSLGDALMVVATISPDLLDEREQAARDLQHCTAAITILDIGGVGFDQQRPAIGIDQGMAVAALYLLARVLAPWAAAFRCFDALAVDDGRARAGFAPHALTIRYDQGVVHPLEHRFVPQTGKPAVDRLPGRKVLR